MTTRARLESKKRPLQSVKWSISYPLFLNFLILCFSCHSLISQAPIWQKKKQADTAPPEVDMRGVQDTRKLFTRFRSWIHFYPFPSGRKAPTINEAHWSRGNKCRILFLPPFFFRCYLFQLLTGELVVPVFFL